MNKILAAMAATAALAAFGPATTVLAQAPAPAATPAAAPQWQAVLKQVLDQIEASKIDYDKMTPELAAAARPQEDQMKQIFGQLGKLTDLKFDGMGPQGTETYTATFEHGALRWLILVQPDGKISALGAMPAG
jgi:hypothetical protein